MDDSKIARKQITRCLQDVGVEVVALEDGRQAWNHLEALVENGERPQDHYLMMISDIEMPEMDGYTLTSNIRGDSRMNGFFIVLHSSLSGVFNKAMVQKVGADDFIAKFDPDILAEKSGQTGAVGVTEGAGTQNYDKRNDGRRIQSFPPYAGKKQRHYAGAGQRVPGYQPLTPPDGTGIHQQHY